MNVSKYPPHNGHVICSNIKSVLITHLLYTHILLLTDISALDSHIEQQIKVFILCIKHNVNTHLSKKLLINKLQYN